MTRIITQVEEKKLKEAAKYLLLLDEGLTKTDIAKQLGMSRSTLYERISEWTDLGVLETLREQYMVPRLEEIFAAHDRVLARWPEIVDRIVDVALHSKSERVGLEAAALLKGLVVDPALARTSQSDDQEMLYAGSKDVSLNPVDITPQAPATKLIDGPSKT